MTENSRGRVLSGIEKLDGCKRNTVQIVNIIMPTYKEKKQKLRELVKQEEQQRRKQISEEGHQFVDTDAFKRAEKHYKFYQYRPTDYSKIVKLEQLEMREVEGKKVYILPSPQGAYLVKGFSNIQEQYQIGFEALNRYIYRPYRTNLDGTNGLYEKEEQAQSVMEENLQVLPQEVKNSTNETLYYFNEKIRMSNLGYQYDWPKRCYPSTKVPVPQTILSMTSRAVRLFESISQSKIDYQGEAVIVNYYKPKDYMTGHLDDGEIDQINPIFSFCFGLSCVFLLGFPDRAVEPLALRLDAGDLMIMSGYSRICYHGVPRIIEQSYQDEGDLNLELEIPENSEGVKYLNRLKQICNYFKEHRLNVNIRQVYPTQSQKQESEEMMMMTKSAQNVQPYAQQSECTNGEISPKC